MPEMIYNQNGVVVNNSEHVQIHNTANSNSIPDWNQLLAEAHKLHNALCADSGAVQSDLSASSEVLQASQSKSVNRLTHALKKLSLNACGMIKDLGLSLLADYLHQFMPWA